MTTLSELNNHIKKQIAEMAIARAKKEINAQKTQPNNKGYFTVQNTALYANIVKDTATALAQVSKNENTDLAQLAEIELNKIQNNQQSDLPKKRELFDTVINGFKTSFAEDKFRQSRYYVVFETA